MSDFDKVVKEISENHLKILDDWCKAYCAELYEEGLTELKPGMFVLCEREHCMENGKFVKNYYTRKKTEQELMVEQVSIWKNLDEEKPEIGQHVLIYLKYPGEGGNFKEVVYTNEHDLPLMFHSVDFHYGWPDTTHWMQLPPPPKPHKKEKNEAVRKLEFLISIFCLKLKQRRFKKLLKEISGINETLLGINDE